MFSLLKDLRSGCPPRGIRSMLLVYAPLAVLLIAAWFAAGALGRQVEYFTRDPSTTMREPFYIGIISSIGILCWALATAVCLVCWLIARRDRPDWRGFWAFATAISAFMLFDDYFLFHEEIFSHYLFPEEGWLHLNEKIVFILYGIALIYFLSRFQDLLRRTPYLFLLVAMGFMALSILTDRGIAKMIIPNKQMRVLAEDGFKLLGAAGWAHYFLRTARLLLRMENIPAK